MQSESASTTALTKREVEALTLLAHGSSNGDIARALGISESTVALHLFSARKRLCAISREHAVALALSMGLIAPPRWRNPLASDRL